jgi:hypothetical protein
MRGKRKERKRKGRKDKTEKKSGIGKTNKSRLLDEKKELPCRTVHLYSCYSTEVLDEADFRIFIRQENCEYIY